MVVLGRIELELRKDAPHMTLDRLLAEISPERPTEPIVAHRPVPGYPPRAGTSRPGTQTSWSGTAAHP